MRGIRDARHSKHETSDPSTMEMQQHLRGYLVVAHLVAVAVGATALIVNRPRPEPIVIVEPTVQPTLSPTARPIQVHVVGAVRNSGIYSLPPESRLSDAVGAAGGMTQRADPERINLADFLRDGQQVYVPTIDTPVPPSPTPLASVGGIGVGQRGAGVIVNINTASVTELETLPGIGPVLAQRIVAYREAQGPFQDAAEIKKVAGIGEARYAQIETSITTR